MIWKHISVELPPINERVLVMTKNGKYTISMRYLSCVGDVDWTGSGSFVNSIVAWAHIPHCPFSDETEIRGIKVGDWVDIDEKQAIVESLNDEHVFAQNECGTLCARYSRVKKINR